jgi:acetyltransferase-like isoleucine patch superfamily enzyme
MWLETRTIPNDAQDAFTDFLADLNAKLENPETKRNELCRELLAQFLYASSYSDVLARAPIAALNLDPNNITLEAEYYTVIDLVKFAAVKPLLWLWYNFDLSPAAQSVEFGVRFRRVLARHIFNRVGRNFKAFPGVQFSVGYNLSVGNDVTIHRNVLVDDIGGVTLHDRSGLSDFVNVYSHTHSPLETPDVTLKHTTIGAGVRVTYHATVLAGTTLSDDSMIGTMSVVTKDIAPHTVAFGIPAKPQREKIRPEGSIQVDSRIFVRPPDRKANPDFPDFKTTHEQTRALRELTLKR